MKPTGSDGVPHLEQDMHAARVLLNNAWRPSKLLSWSFISCWWPPTSTIGGQSCSAWI